MHIDLQLLPFPPAPSLLSKVTVVVIDVLRATSVIVQAMAQGAQEVLPVTEVEEAFKIVKHFPHGTTLLGGERGSRKIEGFDLGNSPREYTADKVKGKRLILTTTNGTKAFHAVSSGKETLAGCFFNIEAVKKRCLESGNGLLIYPSGDEGKFSLEDTVCGGMLIDRILRDKPKTAVLTDASRSAHLLYQRFKKNIFEALSLSAHGKDLIEKGFEEDLIYCAQIDITDVVPVFREGVLRSVNGQITDDR
jgi:2-phosphosulfolactate phosphatase